MAKKEKRFEVTYQQGALVDIIEVLVDRETGVNYLFRTNGNAGGMTPLLDREGKPVISTIANKKVEKEWEL